MSADLAWVLALLAAAVVMFAANRPRMDVVALIMMTALPLTGVIGLDDALAGFSDPNVVLIALLFVIGDSLARTGVARWLGDRLVIHAAGSEPRLVAAMMVAVALMGSVMSSTAVVAIFIPVALRIARSTGIEPGTLMMPLSVAALISGMITLVATAPNLVVHAELVRRGFEGFGFFAFAPFGLPLLGLAVVYMIFARRRLAKPAAGQAKHEKAPSLSDWIAQYGLAGREYRLLVRSGSPLAGRDLAQLDLRGSAGVGIIAIERTPPADAGVGSRLQQRLGRPEKRRMLRPTADTVLQAGDILLLDCFEPAVDIEQLQQRFDLQRLPLSGDYFTDRSQDIGMVEVMLPPTSKLIGRTVIEARFRSEYELTAIGLRRGPNPHPGGVLGEALRLGDTLLLVGAWKAIRKLQASARDMVVLNLPAELDEVVPAARRGPQAVLTIMLVMGLMVGGVVPNVLAALIGCLLLGLLRCIDLESAYRSIHWQSLIVIVGMLPFSLALQKTGGIDLAVEALLGALGGAGIHAVLAGLFVLTAVLGLFISNTATAVLMAPVALGVADQMQVSPYPFAMIVALAASSAFMTPVSSPVNMLVVGPGGYTFRDFVRIGVPFTAVALLVSVILVPWLLPP